MRIKIKMSISIYRLDFRTGLFDVPALMPSFASRLFDADVLLNIFRNAEITLSLGRNDISLTMLY